MNGHKESGYIKFIDQFVHYLAELQENSNSFNQTCDYKITYQTQV
jgi:hypothetical protein